MEYLHVSSDANSFANRFSSSSYVDPPSFRLQLTPDTHHPESVPRSVPRSVSSVVVVGRGAQVLIVNGNLRLQLLIHRYSSFLCFSWSVRRVGTVGWVVAIDLRAIGVCAAARLRWAMIFLRPDPPLLFFRAVVRMFDASLSAWIHP